MAVGEAALKSTLIESPYSLDYTIGKSLMDEVHLDFNGDVLNPPHKQAAKEIVAAQNAMAAYQKAKLQNMVQAATAPNPYGTASPGMGGPSFPNLLSKEFDDKIKAIIDTKMKRVIGTDGQI